MPDSNSIAVPIDDLTIVLNAIAASEDEITVSHLCDTIGQLYTFEVGDAQDSTIQFEKSVDEYASARTQIMGEQAKAEVPDSDAYLRSFTTSVLDFANEAEITKSINRYANRDPSEGLRPVYGVIDANLIRWQLGDSLGIEPENGGLNGSLLVTGIRDELHQYGGDEKINSTTELETELHQNYGRLINQFKGQCRQQRLGLEQYQYLDSQIYAEERKSDTGDANILAECEEFRDESGYDLMFFSNDENAVKMATEKNIIGQQVEFPESLGEETTVTWNEFELLLYVHAMLFGIIRLPKVDLYGVWVGSSGGTSGHVLVECRSRKVRNRIERDKAVLETWRNASE